MQPSGVGFATRVLRDKDKEIVATRIEESELHYEFVPGLVPRRHEPFYWYWMLKVTDDLGTLYRDDNGGARGPYEGGPATHATRDLGAHIPDAATQLTIRFTPVYGWQPPDPWCRQLDLNLASGAVAVQT